MAVEGKHQFITSDWKQWIAENVLRGGDRDELAYILSEYGFPRELALLEIDVASSHPYIEAARSLARQIKKRDWVLNTTRVLENLQPLAEVKRLPTISKDQFLNDFYFKNQPVILTEAINDWPANTQWTKDYLNERCGHHDVQIQARRNSSARYEIDNQAHESMVNFSDYLEMVYAETPTNDYYMTANNAGANSQLLRDLREDFDLGLPYLSPDPSNDRVFFWFGPAGTVTPVHHDLTNNFMAQVIGRKQIKLISPAHLPILYNHLHCYSEVDLDAIDFESHPLFRDVRVQEVTLNPGELFFLPVGWWHHVLGLDITITLTCTNFCVENDFARTYETYGEI